MRTRSQILLLAATMIAGATSLRAQIVADGATTTLSNVTNNITGTLTVGTNGSFTLLTLANNALLTNSTHAVIGRNSTAKSNEVRLVSATARWRMGGDLSVGSNGAMSRLVISNGALAENFIGSLATGVQSSNNFALVTGSGSLWSNRSDVIVGWFGRGNQMIVRNGGRVVNLAGGTIGSQASAPGNVVTVTGNGSIWNAGSALTVGYLAANNQLVIEAGGRVDCGTGRVGYNTGSNNLALVTGLGSLWSNVSLQIGGFGANNQLIVSNGATVIANVDGFLGHDPGASNNVALVTGTGSMWTIGDGLLVGYQEGRNQLVVSNGGTVANGIGHLGYFSIANNNAAVVTGAGSVWSNRLSLNVGFDGASNRLDVNNGATVTVGANALLGVNFGANSNTVIMTGSGSAWLVSSNLVVGSNGFFNLMRISDGARMANHEGLIGANSDGNSVLVTDTNSVWTNRSVLMLGIERGQNQLVISNGAGVHSGGAFIGYGDYQNGGASANSVLVHGVGSYWSNSGSIYIGYSGDFNALVVTNGGRVVSSGGGDIGYRPGSIGTSHVFDNYAIVSGPGSLWSMGGALNFGHDGNRNRLQVDNGGKVFSAGGQIGDLDGFANSATISGSGSAWINTGLLYLGRHGSAGNSLSVNNGGLVSAPSVTITGFGLPANSIVVNNASLVVTNVLGTGSLQLNGGSTTFDTGLIDADQFELRSTNIFFFNHGTLVTGGGTIDYGSPFIISAPNSLPRVWQIRPGGGDLSVPGGVIVGTNAGFVNNLVQLNGGTIRVTNASRSSLFDLRRGTNQLNSGVMEVDGFLMTNTAGILEFNGGTLRTRSTVFNNGRVFTVGNGVNAAALELFTGTHSFSNHLVVAGNAALAGTGTINGNITTFGGINPGFSPGASVGSLFIKGNLKLHTSSALAFELGGVGLGFQDEIVVTNFAELAGMFSISLINGFYPGPTTSLTVMRFASFSGQFANVSLAGARINTADNRASFFVSYTPTSVVISGAQYVDSDGDGISDIKELLAGTDPNDPASVLALMSVSKDAIGRYVIVWQSVAGKNYRVEYSNALTTWQAVTGTTFTQPATNRLQWIDDGSLTGGLPAHREYRIRLQ